MPSLNETLKVDFMSLLAYGPSGAGKTTGIAWMAAYEEFRPIYFFDWDLRIASLKAKIPSELWQFIHSDPYRDDKVQGEALIFMQAKMEKLEKEGFKTAVIDSASFMMNGVMNRILALDGNKPSTSIPQLQHYNAQKSMVTDIISRFCSKKMHVVMTCHEDTDKDEVTGRLFKSLDLTGKLAGKMPGYFNEFWHAEIQQLTGRESQFVFRTRGDMIYAARTAYRLDAIEPAETIWGKIVAQRKERIAKIEAASSAPQVTTVGK